MITKKINKPKRAQEKYEHHFERACARSRVQTTETKQKYQAKMNIQTIELKR